MKRRKWREPERENPHELRVIRAVEVAGVSDEEKPFYLAFARELLRAQLRPVPGVPGVTALVAQKWFRRGLSGHKLWLIGRELAGVGQSREA